MTSIQLEPARVPFAADLACFGSQPAIFEAGRTVTYGELAVRVEEFGRVLGSGRRLVALAAANDVGSLVAYLGAIAYGHPLILLPSDKPAALKSLVAVYDPDVVVTSSGGQYVVDERRPVSAHELHPDLALLLSTSGSTGSPKLVRLSHANLQSNAESIASYLGITSDDRAATTLPMSYCYGLSVINSHLLRGAGLVLTGRSVVDPCFWESFRLEGATSFAAVPYTFELLERVGFADMDLPSLRYVTQAGGRLAPEAVRSYAELGRRRGWDLFVMYGQTEATARMAYLPPDLAASYPGAIGVPVPGGSFRLESVPGLADGELVYSGPNVMLGYAGSPDDLALGRTVTELRTGDLARKNEAGLFEVTGRRSRFVKIVGLRVDLGQVERSMADLGVPAASAGTDQRLVVAVEGEHDTQLLSKVLARNLGLPPAAVVLHAVTELPRLTSGKVDYPAVAALAEAAPAPARPESHEFSGSPTSCESSAVSSATGSPDTVRRIFEETLEQSDIRNEDTFVSLGGDSLSFVAASVRLEQLLGHLPPDWHVTPVGKLEPRPGQQQPRRWRGRLLAPMDSSVVLRAVGILLIAGTHIGLFHWQGMAHVLIAAAGFNFARFQLTGERWPRLRRQLTSVARIAIPSMVFIAFAYVVTDRYGLVNIVLLNAIAGSEQVTTQWHFWFIEIIVYIMLAMTALLAVPWLHKAERRFPFLFPLALFGAGLLTRYEHVEPGVPYTVPALWLFALGWAVARAQSVVQRCAVSALALLTVPGFFADPSRDYTLMAGVLVLAWLPVLPVPRAISRLTVLLAAASMHIYLVHWLVYPALAPISLHVALAASLAAGIAYCMLCTAVAKTGSRFLASRRRDDGGSGPPSPAPLETAAGVRES